VSLWTHYVQGTHHAHDDGWAVLPRADSCWDAIRKIDGRTLGPYPTAEEAMAAVDRRTARQGDLFARLEDRP